MNRSDLLIFTDPENNFLDSDKIKQTFQTLIDSNDLHYGAKKGSNGKMIKYYASCGKGGHSKNSE